MPRDSITMISIYSKFVIQILNLILYIYIKKKLKENGLLKLFLVINYL